MVRQQSPWEIGHAYYNQRDLYTRDARIDEAGYATGPSFHPEDGSYAYRRPPREPGAPATARAIHPPPGADLFQREAWPWLNYAGPDADPYFAVLRPPPPRRGLKQRASTLVTALADRIKARFHESEAWKEADKRIHREVDLALAGSRGLDTSDIEVKVRFAVVTLAGTVPDRRSRKLAGDLAYAVREVRGVENRLEIRKNEPTESNPVFVVPVAAF
jgi:hypothetical protein